LEPQLARSRVHYFRAGAFVTHFIYNKRICFSSDMANSLSFVCFYLYLYCGSVVSWREYGCLRISLFFLVFFGIFRACTRRQRAKAERTECGDWGNTNGPEPAQQKWPAKHKKHTQEPKAQSRATKLPDERFSWVRDGTLASLLRFLCRLQVGEGFLQGFILDICNNHANNH